MAAAVTRAQWVQVPNTRYLRFLVPKTIPEIGLGSETSKISGIWNLLVAFERPTTLLEGKGEAETEDSPTKEPGSARLKVRESGVHCKIGESDVVTT